MFKQNVPNHCELIASVPTPLKTKTGLFVPKLGELFVGVVQRRDKSAEVSVYGAK